MGADVAASSDRGVERKKLQLKPRSAIAIDAAKRFQAVLDDFVSLLGNIGAVAALEMHGVGRCHFTSGYADINQSVTVRNHHQFQIGSQSKTVLAMTVLLLHRAGLLAIDNSVRKYLDLPIDERITIRHLLMNTCGLGEMTLGMPATRFDPRVTLAPRDLVILALPQGQLFEPGSQFDYCNTGWAIAAMIVEAVCARPYGEVVEDRVLRPLGLQNSWFGGVPSSADMLRGYLSSEATGGRIDTSRHLSWAFGAGDGVSCVDDLLDLFGSLCRNDSPLAISLSDLNKVTATPAPAPSCALSVGTRYGLGIERRAWAGSEVWGHPGSTFSYMSGTWLDAERRVTVTSCVTRHMAFPAVEDSDIRYPRAQLFAMALDTSYILARDLDH